MSKKTIFQKRPRSMIAINKKLWAACQAWAKRTYEVHPSAYSNSAAVKRYNKMGGKWRKPSESKIKKRAMDIALDIKESDITPPFSRDEARLIAERMGIKLDEFGSSLEEFHKGLNTELEHKFLTHGDPSDTAMIVIDHLRENPGYYTAIKKIEGENDDEAGSKGEDALPDSEEDEVAMLADFFGVKNHEAVDELYRSMGDDNAEHVKMAKPLGGLGYWHKKEKWVDISRKDKTGKHPPCGRADASKGGKPRCRPASEAAKLTASEKKSEAEKKRRVERTKKRKGKKPHMVKFDYMHKTKKKAEVENMNFQKIAARLTEIATGIDRKGNAEAAQAVDDLTLRIFAMSDEIASLPPATEEDSNKKVAGLRVNDGHSIMLYSSTDALRADVRAGKLSRANVVSAVADALYAAGSTDDQAELAVATDKFSTALGLAARASFVR